MQQTQSRTTKSHAAPQGAQFVTFDLGVDGPMDFWKMNSEQRSFWLDDGLHLTQAVSRGGERWW
jgi:hypothetical protein